MGGFVVEAEDDYLTVEIPLYSPMLNFKVVNLTFGLLSIYFLTSYLFLISVNILSLITRNRVCSSVPQD